MTCPVIVHVLSCPRSHLPAASPCQWRPNYWTFSSTPKPTGCPWKCASCSALLSGGSGSIHSADIRGSNEEISLVLHSLLHPCSLPSHRAAPVLLRSVSCRPGSVATNHQRVPRGSSEHTDLLGLPRSQGSVFPADPEAGTSWNPASSGFCYSIIPPPSPHHSSCHGMDQGTPGFC